MNWGPTVSAKIYVGMARGVQPANNQRRCARAPDIWNQEAVDGAFKVIRARQVKPQNVNTTRTVGHGWYEGVPEKSVQFEVFYDGSDKSVEKFRTNMNTLALQLGARLCQDSVIVIHEHPTGQRQSCNAVWFSKKKSTCTWSDTADKPADKCRSANGRKRKMRSRPRARSRA